MSYAAGRADVTGVREAAAMMGVAIAGVTLFFAWVACTIYAAGWLAGDRGPMPLILIGVVAAQMLVPATYFAARDLIRVKAPP